MRDIVQGNNVSPQLLNDVIKIVQPLHFDMLMCVCLCNYHGCVLA